MSRQLILLALILLPCAAWRLQRGRADPWSTA